MHRCHLPGNRGLGIRMETVFVEDLPHTRGFIGGNSLGLVGVTEHGCFRVEAVTKGIVGMTSRIRHTMTIHLANSVVRTVNHRIDTHGEEVLMVLSIDLGSNNDTIASGSFVFGKNMSVQFTSSLNFIFKGTVLIEIVVETIIVVGN
jgi:hypothetical protein